MNSKQAIGLVGSITVIVGCFLPFISLPIVGDNLTRGLYTPVRTNGILNLQITDTDAGIVGGGVFPYELTVTDPDGLISPFMQGTIQFLDRGY